MSFNSTNFHLGPELTPGAVKKLILYTSLISLLSALFNNVFTYVFSAPGPMDWLSLSWWGMRHYLFFEPFTYLFSLHTHYQGVGFAFLVTLFFDMYILWAFGSDVLYRVGKKPFLRFYFICGILSGLIAFFLMPLINQYEIISGPTPSILAILIAWTFMNPEAKLLLFFLIPIKAKWLTLAIVAGFILTNLSDLNIISFFLYTFASLISYFYGLIAWGLHSPFAPLYKFELATVRFSQKVKKEVEKYFLRIKKSTHNHKQGNIVDISTGTPLNNDDAFIDAMLEKIAKHGQASLTWQEKERMRKISEKKRQQNQ